MNEFVIILFFFLSPGMQQKTPSAGNSFVGTWHGTSICVDHERDSACKDEEVVYVVKGIRSVRDTVEMEAFKIINGERVSMGTMKLAYSEASHLWTFELVTRVHAFWAYEVNDSTANGTLAELPSNRLIRKVFVSRINE